MYGLVISHEVHNCYCCRSYYILLTVMLGLKLKITVFEALKTKTMCLFWSVFNEHLISSLWNVIRRKMLERNRTYVLFNKVM